MILFEMLMLFTIDTSLIGKAQKGKIEVLQVKNITLLQRYLKAKYPVHYTNKIANGMMLLHYAGELQKLHYQRLPI